MPSLWIVLSVLREIYILMDLRTGLICFCPCVGACGSDSQGARPRVLRAR